MIALVMVVPLVMMLPMREARVFPLSLLEMLQGWWPFDISGLGATGGFPDYPRRV
jgi:hypothetical protein